MVATDDKVRENKARRWAKRLGVMLRRSRVRRVHINDHGGYSLINPDTNSTIGNFTYDLSLDGVEAHLAELERKILARRKS